MIRTLYSEAGSAAAEFALALPVVILIIIGILDYADAVNINTKLYSAARAGVQYAIYHPGDTAGIRTAAIAATSDSSMTVGTASTVCKCISTSTGAIGSAVTCTSACAVGSMLGHFLTLSTSQTYTPLLSYEGIGAELTMNGSAQMQVQ
jgi:Flp pilus assembly protein TadG